MSLEEWLLRCPETKREEIMKLADEVIHDCTTCWWLQFGKNRSTRGCKAPGKLQVEMEPDIVSWKCLNWRVDPDAKKREKGYYAFIK